MSSSVKTPRLFRARRPWYDASASQESSGVGEIAVSEQAAVPPGSPARGGDSAPLAEPESPRLTRDLTASVGDAGAFGVMVGIGETYVPAFVLAVGLGDVFAGLISSVPLLIGSLLQLISPWAVERLQSHRKWVVLCSGMQALCFVPLTMAAYQGHITAWGAMAVASLYWGTGLATGPAWNTWQGTTIPRPIRATFFARRSKLQQMFTLAGFVIGGFSLHWGRNSGDPERVVLVFAALFLTAGVCRSLSTLCLSLQSEPSPLPMGTQRVSFREAWGPFTTGPTGAILMLAVSMQVGVYVAGPFFNPYMLKMLNFSYAGYAVLLGASFVAKFTCLPLWGRLAHRFGAQHLLTIGVWGVIPLAGGWVLTTNYWLLLILQVFAGAAWGAYELALMLLFFETIPERQRTAVLTLYNVANSLAHVFGSAIGAAVLSAGGVSQTAYLTVFGVSTALRAVTTFWLYRLPRLEVLSAATVMRPLSMRPSSGSLDEPMLSTLPDQHPDDLDVATTKAGHR